jgi:hypothetical protein
MDSPDEGYILAETLAEAFYKEEPQYPQKSA